MTRSYTKPPNPLAVDEDYWIPITAPPRALLTAEEQAQHDADVKDFNERLFTALQLPRELLGK